MFIQDYIVQTLHFSTELCHSESCQDAWMPENGSSEAASFRQYPPSHLSWWVDYDHHSAVAQEVLYLRSHDVAPFQPSIRSEMCLSIVPSLVVNSNVCL